MTHTTPAFAAWSHQNLVNLCTDLYRQNRDLHQRLRYLTGDAGVVVDFSEGPSSPPAPTAEARNP
jgi:hypothetical protein